MLMLRPNVLLFLCDLMQIDQNNEIRSTTCALYTQLDILYKIFEILIEENTDLRLLILRHGSQVCTPWRGLLLSSPSLWGKSLNFDVLMGTPAWRDEVIRRSGESFAYITRLGSGRPHFDREEELFLGSFIKNNWKRTKSLRIVLPVESVITKIFDISLLQSPHLHLEDLEVREHYLCLRDDDSSTLTLFTPVVERATWKADFGGHAPRLRQYLTEQTFQFPYQSSWLPQLRELQVTVTACLIPNLLDELRNMTSLEHLELTLLEVLTADPDARTRMSNMVLPRLKYLEVNATGHTPESIDFVNYIKPAPGCIMQVIIDYWDALSPSDISSVVRALSAFPLHDGEDGMDDQGWIGVHDSLLRIRSPRHEFLFRGPFESNLWTPCLQHFAASPAYFDNATNVRLTLGKEVVDSISTPSADMTFSRILSNMTSVAHVSTDWITLSLLRRLSFDDESNSESRKALPALESISISGHEADLNGLEVWLDCRATHTLKPIKRVNIYWHSEDYPSLEVFQRFTNLEITLFDWRGGPKY
ncbi:hypothetical protein D9613_003549 [Agrocybe pediades]|uniref:F-box domain-containing protein n=1 Tax=Agrocybe pediades TaxID=84607 RepID=A0A8H4VPC2_9AGAR|nr:hypothetical protein D9613_003549 [Agrocybe pediades]